MSCFSRIFKAQNIFEIKLVEVRDYNSTNQDSPLPKMTSKGDFPYFKKCQAKLVSVRLNEKKNCAQNLSYKFFSINSRIIKIIDSFFSY